MGRFGAQDEREGEEELCGLTRGGLVLNVDLGAAGASAKGGVRRWGPLCGDH